MATVQVSWADLLTPEPPVSVAVSYASLKITVSPGSGTGTDAEDADTLRRGVRAPFVSEGFSFDDPSITTTARMQPRPGNPPQTFSAGGSAPLTITDRARGVRGGTSRRFTTTYAGTAPVGEGLPSFSVEIDADPDTTGLFVVGTSTVGSSAVVALDHRWVALPDEDVLTIGIRRGRSREDQGVDVGQATIVLDGWSGDYDPDNGGTPYQLAGVVMLRTGVGVRIKVDIEGVVVTMFTGTLESAGADHGYNPTVTWSCVDRLAEVGQMALAPVPLSRAGELSSDRADWLLDYAGVADADRAVTTGRRTLVATEGGGTVLSNLEDVAFAEQGRVYADRYNVLRVTQLWNDYSDPVLAIADTGGASVIEPDDIQIEPGSQQVINDVRLARTVKTFVPPTGDDTEGTTTDVVTIFADEEPVSVERHGRRSLSGGQDVPVLLDSDLEATALAEYLATRRAVPASRASAVSMSLVGLPAAVQVRAAGLDIAERVTLARTTADGRALSWELFAEGVDHTISTTGWDLGLSTAPVDNLYTGADPFRVNASIVNGPDVVAVY